MRSGVVIDLSEVKAPKVDKHSTGGVGDKISLHLAPMVAACGVAVPMISGRGLGHTGGTLDKLESIPGFRVALAIAEYKAQVARIGLALVGQTSSLAPADRKLYALRDVTGTVECIPLICASILSKKLAGGTDCLVLDVKFGRGAFMKDRRQATELATVLTSVAAAMGKPARAVLTSMEEPLGHTVGNALEVIEAIECLKGAGPRDVMEVTFALGEQMLLLTRAATDARDARRQLEVAISSGAALEKFRRMIEAQGGDATVIDRPSLLPSARLIVPLVSPVSGFVQNVDALAAADAALRLGAGRTQAEDRVDPAVGISRLVKSGQAIACGQPLAFVHANDEVALAEATELLLGGIEVGSEAPLPRSLIDSVLD
jgi:pyrimidine-nucleoside phosphorylase